MEHLEAGLDQDDVRGLPRDIGRAHHRNPHVGGVQGRGVVDAVAQKAHHVPAALQCEDDAILLPGRYAREDRRLLGHVTERRIVETVELIARDDGLVADADLPTDMTRDDIAVAREDLDLHAVRLELRERVGGIGQDGVREADKPGQHELGFIVSRVRRPGVEPAIRDREHAEPVGTELLVDRRAGVPGGIGQRLDAAIHFEGRRDGQHRFGGALGHQQSRPFGVAGCRHHD